MTPPLKSRNPVLVFGLLAFLVASFIRSFRMVEKLLGNAAVVNEQAVHNVSNTEAAKTETAVDENEAVVGLEEDARPVLPSGKHVTVEQLFFEQKHTRSTNQSSTVQHAVTTTPPPKANQEVTLHSLLSANDLPSSTEEQYAATQQAKPPSPPQYHQANKNTLTCTANRIPNIPSVSPIIKPNQTIIRRMSTTCGKNWGNALSPYWAARAVAELGGYEFQGGAFFGRNTWIEYLPKTAAAKTPRPQDFQKFCSCKKNPNHHGKESNRYLYWHVCNYGWGAISSTIRKDIRHAIETYASKQPQEDQSKVFRFFQRDDWLIYDRCCLFAHSEFATATLQAYDVIPSTGNFTVYAASGRPEGLGGEFCPAFHDIRDAYIKSRNPGIRIVRLEHDAKMWVDFARIVYAPQLLIPASGSSWALWSSLANNGTVVTAPMMRSMDVSVYPSNFQVLENVTLLYPPDGPNADNQTRECFVGRNASLDDKSPKGRERIYQIYRMGC